MSQVKEMTDTLADLIAGLKRERRNPSDNLSADESTDEEDEEDEPLTRTN